MTLVFIFSTSSSVLPNVLLAPTKADSPAKIVQLPARTVKLPQLLVSAVALELTFTSTHVQLSVLEDFMKM